MDQELLERLRLGPLCPVVSMMVASGNITVKYLSLLCLKQMVLICLSMHVSNIVHLKLYRISQSSSASGALRCTDDAIASAPSPFFLAASEK